MKILKVLVACEESQVVCKAFRELGHESYSNDVIECSGGHPEWHLQMDCFEAIKLKKWDLMIAHPPCTHLAVSGAAWFEQKRKDGRQQQGIDFFMKLTQTNIKHWCIENPVCIMSNIYRKPDQIIQPYEYGHTETKKTCLWLSDLPLLKSTNIVEPVYIIAKDGKRYSPTHYMWQGKTKDERSKQRSKTFTGIAEAMAKQWSAFIINENN